MHSKSDLLINSKPVTAEKTFIPKTSFGTVKLEFKFDASELKGKEVVVFEDLYRNESLITSHADINDLDQTVKFVDPDTPEKKTPGENTPSKGSGNPKTGDAAPLLVMIIAAIASGLTALYVLNKKKPSAKATDEESNMLE